MFKYMNVLCSLIFFYVSNSIIYIIKYFLEPKELKLISIFVKIAIKNSKYYSPLFTSTFLNHLQLHNYSCQSLEYNIACGT